MESKSQRSYGVHVPRRKKGRKIKGQFVPLPYNMIDSMAWKSLLSNTIKVYICLLRKRDGTNDRDLSLTYCEMKGQLSTATFRKCIKELVGKGFIDLVRPGGLQKQCNIYGISERWRMYDQPDFENISLPKWNYHGFGMTPKDKEKKNNL